MATRRLSIVVTCAMCPVQFHPWCRKRALPPTCSVKCARAQTGLAQLGRPMTAALAGVQAKRENEAEAVGRRFGSRLTPREVAIYRHGVRIGVGRTYRRVKSYSTDEGSR